MEVHVVVRGDTLWKISRQYGIPFEELKRVNAHLANPDYIVPGMKIFLPAKHSGGKEKEPVKHSKPTHTLPQEQKPIQKPTQKPAPTTPAKPTPKPPVKPMPKPEPPVLPKPVPPVAPPTPKPPAPPPPMPPVAPPAPPMPPAHQMPMQPQMRPVFAIPCGWMPIFDADCYPFMHPGQAPHVPMPPAPMPSPMPPEILAPSKPVLGIDDKTPLKCPEPMPVPMPMPVDNTLPSGWQLLESPDILFDESPSMDVRSTTDESPFMQQDQQQPMPYLQTMPMEGMQPQPIQYPPSGCGCSPTMNCGCGRYHPMPIIEGMQQQPMQYSPSGCGCSPTTNCGCGRYHPMPIMEGMQQQPMQYPPSGCGCSPTTNCGCGRYHPMPMPMHMAQPINHCNACNQPIQPMPYQMNPQHQRGQNWFGSY